MRRLLASVALAPGLGIGVARLEASTGECKWESCGARSGQTLRDEEVDDIVTVSGAHSDICEADVMAAGVGRRPTIVTCGLGVVASSQGARGRNSARLA